MATAYPAGLDTFDNPTDTTQMDDAGFEHDLLHSDVNDAIEAIEAELGTDPAGASVTVKDRLDAIEASETFVHDQSTTATTWTVTHNLGRRPAVMAFDSVNREILGRVDHVSDNELTIEFNQATSGKAYCN